MKKDYFGSKMAKRFWHINCHLNFFLPETGFYTTEMPPIQVSANQGTVSSSRQDTSTKSLWPEANDRQESKGMLRGRVIWARDEAQDKLCSFLFKYYFILESKLVVYINLDSRIK